MRVLVVAPDSNLINARAEVQNIINTTGAKALIGNVTVRDFFDHITENKYDYIHFVAHGSSDGVCLSDKCISPTTLAQIISIAEPSVLYINTCSSILTAIAVKEVLPSASIVTTISEVDDEEAYISGSLFAKLIKENNWDAERAYEKSRKRNSANYVFLKGTPPASSYPGMIEDGKLVDAIIGLGSKMERYETKVVAISASFLAVAEEVRELGNKIDDIKDGERPAFPFLWMIGYALFSLSVFLMPESYNLFFFLDPEHKVGLAVLLQIIAAGFFAAGLGWITFLEKR